MSSDSSEDEEEAQKISQAVIPDELLSFLAPIAPKTESEKNNPHIRNTDGNGRGANNLQKSRRSDKNQDEDDNAHGYFLKTTPEFRAHIANHLTKILDTEVEAHEQCAVWNKPRVYKKKKEKGIQLFSGVKSLCLGESISPSQESPSVFRKPPKIQPKKHRLKSSSESSDEEDKITSCVFTVDDIHHENRMLETLSASVVKSSDQEKESKQNGNALRSANVDDAQHKQKKKKRKICNTASEHEINGIVEDSINDSNNDNLVTHDKKNKTKHVSKMGGIEDGSCHTDIAGEDCDQSAEKKKNKKKKKKRKKSEEDDV